MSDGQTEKTGFLEEEPGQTSAMRVMTSAVVAAVVGVFLVGNVMMLFKYWVGTGMLGMMDFSPYALAAVLSAFTAKFGQKGLENMDKIADLVNKLKGKS